MIAVALQAVEVAGGAMTRSALPTSHPAPKDLRYGENPHQKAQWMPDVGAVRCLPGRFIRGRSSRTPTSSISTPRCELRSSSPSRLASSSSTRTRAAWPWGRRLPRPTYERARPIPCRRLAASSASTARSTPRPRVRLTSTFIEAVIAPAVAEEAKPILATKANLRVATADFAKLAALDSELARDARSVPWRHADAGPRSS